MNITGNIISGQVSGDTAKQLSERFGKILQNKSSLSINSSDTSINRSLQLDLAILASKIAGLSSGEFVDMVADDSLLLITLKAFHYRIQNNHEALKREEKDYKPLPVVRQINLGIIQRNYLQIKKDVEAFVINEIERMMLDPELNALFVTKKKR